MNTEKPSALKQAQSFWFSLAWYWRISIMAVILFILVKFFRIIDLLVIFLNLLTVMLVAMVFIVTVIGVSVETKNGIVSFVESVMQAVTIKLREAGERIKNPQPEPHYTDEGA